MQLEVESLKEKIKEARVQLLLHPVYAQINNLEGLKNFTQFQKKCKMNNCVNF
jgi:hypothetical protein